MSLDRLQSQLMTSGLQNRDNPLFQVITQIIKSLRDVELSIASQIAAVPVGTSNGSITSNEAILTSGVETTTLPNSRQLLAGLGIGFNDAVANKRTLNLTHYWSLLTDGNVDETDFIFANGEPISIQIPL